MSKSFETFGSNKFASYFEPPCFEDYEDQRLSSKYRPIKGFVLKQTNTLLFDRQDSISEHRVSESALEKSNRSGCSETSRPEGNLNYTVIEPPDTQPKEEGSLLHPETYFSESLPL